MNETPKNNMQDALAHLAGLPAIKMADDERVANKFIELYNKVHGNNMGKEIYEVERFHFMKQITEKVDLQECSKLSLYGAFIDVAIQGLSFDPSKNLCYLVPGNVNIGTKDNKKYEKRAQLQISPYGELYLRQYYGQIQTADNPVLVYEGDEFEIITGKSGRVVNHKAIYPRKSNNIIACFVRIVKIDGTIDFGITDMNDIARLKKYSEKKNFGDANKLYGKGNGDVDSGFLIAKTIKHAFKAYPKVRLRGQFSALETDENNGDFQPMDYELGPGENTIATDHPTKQEEVKSEAAMRMTVSNKVDDEIF